MGRLRQAVDKVQPAAPPRFSRERAGKKIEEKKGLLRVVLRPFVHSDGAFR
jgi:hypothetical protein